jgi:hypothetical protein
MIWRRIIVILSLLLIVAAFLALWISLGKSDELGSKPESSFLQALEKEYRDKPLVEKLLIKRRGKYCAVGIVATNNSERVWVLLNPRFQPLVKVSSDADYELTPKDVEWLRGQCDVDDSVAGVLRKHIR